jgi:hypothetical protein
MGKICEECGKETIFFVWSSTKGFPREKLIHDNMADYIRKGILCGNIGLPICMHCATKLGYIKD